MKKLVIAVTLSLWCCAVVRSQAPAKPFKGVEPPDWVWTSLNQMFDVSTPEQIEAAAGMGVEVIYSGDVQTAHKHGIKVIGEHEPFPADVLAKNPDWHVRYGDKLETEPSGCILSSPYRQVWIDAFVSAEKKHHYDGFSFDSIGFFPFCRCKYCQEQYRQDSGREIPNPMAGVESAKDHNVLGRIKYDKDYALYLRWLDGRLELLLRDLRTQLQAVNPDCCLLMWTTNAGRWGHFATSPHTMSHAAHLLMDCPAQEWWLDETNMGNSLAPAYGARLLRAVSRERPTVCNPYDFTHWEDVYLAGYGSSMPLFERTYRYALAITNGSIPATVFGAPYRPGDAAKLTAFFRAREPWLIREKSVKWAALVISDNTRNFYGQRVPVGRYVEHVLGSFRAATEAHLPFDLITDVDLEENRLNSYKVVILANTACLSDLAVEHLRDFVNRGGGLVATVASSLYDDLGEQRKDFALADVFGVHYAGMAKETGASPGSLAAIAPVAFAEARPWESAGGAKALVQLADTVPEIVDAKVKEIAWHGGGFMGKLAIVKPDAKAVVGATGYVREPDPAIAPAATPPAFVVNKPGTGRVAYFAAGIDQGYWAYPYPYQSMLLTNAIRWAAGSPPPIRVDTLMSVQATYFEQQDKSGRRTIVHLLNSANTMGGHASPLGCDTPTRMEAAPVHDIAVTFSGPEPVRIHLEPEAKDLKATKVADGWQVTVPVLELHSMVVAEMGK